MRNTIYCQKLKGKMAAAKATKKLATDSCKQFSWLILWTTAGDMPNLWGLSGSPVVMAMEGTVIGFQNFEWGGGAKWAEEIEHLKLDDEDAAEVKALAVSYPMYGIYILPEEAEGWEIVDSC